MAITKAANHENELLNCDSAYKNPNTIRVMNFFLKMRFPATSKNVITKLKMIMLMNEVAHWEMNSRVSPIAKRLNPSGSAEGTSLQ